MSLKLAYMQGDGIGPEIMTATLNVLNALDHLYDLGLVLYEHEIGLKAICRQGASISREVLDACLEVDGIIMGPVDTYAYPPVEEGGVNPSAYMRKSLDLFANIRPSRVYPDVPSAAKEMNLVIVRENTEGFYADRNMYFGLGEFMPTENLALSVRKISREGSIRIAENAFELAMIRRRKVTVVHKANVLKVSDGLFLNCVREVAEQYPNVVLEEELVDAMAAHLIRTPERFDVIVTTNMYGDILSDEAAELSGGLGLGGSVNAGEKYIVAQAAHGAAPNIAGQNIANPSALMSSVALLLTWIDKRDNKPILKEASLALESALASALSDPLIRTQDLGGSGTTEKFCEAVSNILTR